MSGLTPDKSTVRVFLVEDEPTTIILTEAMLNQLGYLPVGVATSFETAMAAIKVTPVDIVLVDLTLSGIKTGFDVIRELNHLNIPCVLISGTINEQTLNQIVDLEIFGFLPKPYDSLALATTIQLALKKFTRMQDRIFDEADSIKSRILSLHALESEFGSSEKLYLIKRDSRKKPGLENAVSLSYHRLIQWIVAFCLFLMAMVGVGYFFNLPFLVTLASQAASIKVNAALCVLLLCFCLAVENSFRLSKSWRIFSLGSMITVFAIGSVTFLQYVLSVDFGIDEFLLRDRFVNEFNLPGRMAIPTALCLITLPLALFFNRLKTFRYSSRITEGLALGTLFLAMVGTFGHLFNQIEFNTIIPYLTQSRVTLIAEILIALGVLFLNPKKGLMSIFSNQRVSAKLGRRMLFSVNASIVAISLLIYYFVPQSEYANLEVIFILITSILILSSVILWSTFKQIKNELHIEQTVKLLKNRERELQFVLKRIPYPVAVLDKELRYILVSRKWVDDLNLKNKNIVGNSIYETFPGLPEKIKSLHQRALGGEIVKMANEGIMDFSGNRVVVKGEMRPWFDINDKIAGIIIFLESSTTYPATFLKD